VLDDEVDPGHARSLLPAWRGCATLVTSRSPLVGLDCAIHASLLSLSIVDARELITAIEDAALVGPHARGLDPVLDVCAGDRSVVASLRSSYEVLEAGPSTLLRLLASSPLLDAGTDLGARLLGVDESSPDGLLYRLVYASLVEPAAHPVELDGSGQTRFRLHDLVRAFAAGLAAADPPGLHRGALDRVVAYYVNAVYAAGSRVSGGRSDRSAPILPVVRNPPHFPDAPSAVGWFEQERPDLLAVFHRRLVRAALCPQ